MKILRTDPDRFGIRARLLTLLLPAILGLLIFDSWSDHRALRRLVQDAYDQSMFETATALRGSVVPGPQGRLVLRAQPGLLVAADGATALPKYLGVRLTPVSGQAGAPTDSTWLGEADLPPLPEPPETAATAGPAASLWYEGYYRGQPVRVVALPGRVADGHGRSYELLALVVESSGPRDRALAESADQALLRDARMVLVVVLLVWLGVTWSLHPLEKLRKSVLLSEGRPLQPLDTSDVPHEVAPLVAAINLHVERYQALLDEQSQFLADASHQLRTPLAIMLTQAGVALREKDTTRIHEILRALRAQISRSRRLAEQLLSLADANDSTTQTEAPEMVDMRQIAKDVVLQYLALAHEHDQDLGWDDSAADVPITVLARGLELHEVLSNLVHNAIVHTSKGGRITVNAQAQGPEAWVAVTDNGPGIAADQRERVFQRFQQGGGAGQSRNTHGAGLGLAIARAYARRNGGDIVLEDALPDATESQPASGLRAVLKLPLAHAKTD